MGLLIRSARVDGFGSRRLLLVLAIWAVLAVVAVTWWKPWERHPNAQRAAQVAAEAAAQTGKPGEPASAADAVTQNPATGAPPSPSAPATAIPTDPAAGDSAQATDGVPLPDPATLLAGSHVKLARVAEGQVEELDDGARVTRGDRLRLGVLLPYRMHVYAFNQEAGAATTTMFPLTALPQRNPLPAGNNELPGMLNGQSASYEVMGRGASEEILLVLALEPNPLLDAKLSQFGQVEEGEVAPPAPDGEFSIDALAKALDEAQARDELRVFRWRLEHAP